MWSRRVIMGARAMAKKRVAVTGGSGRVGEHIVKALIDHGHQVINIDREFSAASAYHTLIAGDNYGIGVQAGNYFADQLKCKGSFKPKGQGPCWNHVQVGCQQVRDTSSGVDVGEMSRHLASLGGSSQHARPRWDEPWADRPTASSGWELGLI